MVELNRTAISPSSEILIALPNANNSKKYTTYLGLVDSGSSGSLINKDIVNNGNFEVQVQKKPTKWDTASGTLLTQGKVEITNCCLPQFTRKHHIANTIHIYTKRPNDKYDIFLGRDLLQAIGLDIHYSASQFTWDNISVAMVPSGYWTKEKISTIAKSWNKQISEPTNEVQITEIFASRVQANRHQ
jgi:hypothetical protein